MLSGSGAHDQREHLAADLEAGDLISKRIVLDNTRKAQAQLENLIPT